MNAANAKLLEQLCGQGDFLYSKRRSLVVRETMGCIATCPGQVASAFGALRGCQKLHVGRPSS